jgi:virginiamycin B lyase
MWIGYFSAPKVGRVSLAGEVTEYSLPVPPGAGLRVTSITTGPDGYIWFTEMWPTLGGAIGRIAPSGSPVETFTLSNDQDVQPLGIVTGPDNNLWFTESGIDQVGKITPDGQITLFPIRTKGGHPKSIVQGPDKNLWFTEPGANKIGKITLDGNVTEFDIPTPGSEPAGIVTGPDGAIWFTELTKARIGRVDPSTGKIREFPLTPGFQPLGITAHDGSLWITEKRTNVILRATLEPS